MKLAVATLALVFLAAPASAQASEAAIASRSGIPTPALTLVSQPCPEGGLEVSGVSCSYAAQGLAYSPVEEGAFIREHEIGHVFDVQYLDDGERSKLTRDMGLGAAPWYHATGLDCVGAACPSEWFADAYASCRLRLDPRREWTTSYDYQPSERRNRIVCGTIRRAGRDLA